MAAEFEFLQRRVRRVPTDVTFLGKPWTLSELLIQIRAVLAESSSLWPLVHPETLVAHGTSLGTS